MPPALFLDAFMCVEGWGVAILFIFVPNRFVGGNDELFETKVRDFFAKLAIDHNFHTCDNTGP